MTRAEFRQYILDHRDETEALSIYLERFKSPDSKVFPAPQTIEDLENFPSYTLRTSGAAAKSSIETNATGIIR